MELSAELSVVLANRIPEITGLAERIERFLLAFDVPEATAFQVNLALDELLTNTISYGYRDGEPHPIGVRLRLVPGVIEIVIDDDAVAFDPFSRAPVDTAATIDERDPGGLGIHLVKTLIDDVAYRRVGDRNRVTLRQNFAAAPAPAPAEEGIADE
jgi:anti-sigma regulatory factor (Ser/Thr protein kinase)